MDAVTTTLLALSAIGLVTILWLLRDRYRLVAERDLARARLSDVERLRSGFQAVAGDVLRNSNAEFLRLAKETLAARETGALAEMDKRRVAFDQVVGSIQRAVERTHEELRRAEKDNAGLREQVVRMTTSSRELRRETGRLTQALRQPNVRGRYGEIQLQRVVELAGMTSYCDFTPQEALRAEGGQLQKPDLVVRLPNGRVVAVDAKTSFDAYMDAIAAEDPDERASHLDRHAQNFAEQVKKLSEKRYWANFEDSPELVVMFVPGDQLVDAALERRPELLEVAAERNVVLASPSTLIGLLRAVQVGWREKNLTDSAEELFQLGRTLHRRAATVLDHATQLGADLDGARRSYNAFVGSVQGRLLPTLRRFEERDARSSRQLVSPQRVEGELRELDRRPPADDAERAPSPRIVAGGG